MIIQPLHDSSHLHPFLITSTTLIVLYRQLVIPSPLSCGPLHSSPRTFVYFSHISEYKRGGFVEVLASCSLVYTDGSNQTNCKAVNWRKDSNEAACSQSSQTTIWIELPFGLERQKRSCSTGRPDVTWTLMLSTFNSLRTNWRTSLVNGLAETTSSAFVWLVTMMSKSCSNLPKKPGNFWNLYTKRGRNTFQQACNRIRNMWT